jgi:hypothetical protein
MTVWRREFIKFHLAFRQTNPPAVVVDHDGDVIRIVEGRRASIERGMPNEPCARSSTEAIMQK